MLANTATHDVIWEKLPDDFVLDNEPVDNINQPLLAAALTESLELAGRLPADALTITNYGICATLNNRFVVKAPDWGYVSSIRVSREEVRRSYTPRLQGDIPVIVMEFISDTEGGEYSSKPTYPQEKNAAQQLAEQERQRAEQERQRAERLAAQLKALGVEPEV